MGDLFVRYLMLHGSIILGIGLLTGLPFWYVLIRLRAAETVRAWRVAHTTLIADGLMLLILGRVIPGLQLAEVAIRVLAWSLIMSGYSFVFALAVGASTGYRGLSPKPYGINTLFFLGHTVGAVGSLIGVGIVIWGGLQSTGVE